MKKYFLSILIVTLSLISTQSFAAKYEILGGSMLMPGVWDEPNIAGGGFIEDGNINSSVLGDFLFFGTPFSTHFVGTAPQINLNGLSDFTGFSYAWQGVESLQGSNSVESINNNDGTYTLTWNIVDVGGPTDGFTRFWSMEIKPVPVPAAIWFFGSALAALFTYSKNRKKS